MSMMRRSVLFGGAVFGIGLLGYGGSLAGCHLSGRKLARLQTFFASLDDMVAPRQIGQVYLRQRGAGAVLAELEGRNDLITLSLLPPSEMREARFKAIVEDDFAAGRSDVVDGWVVARTEALLAGAAAV